MDDQEIITFFDTAISTSFGSFVIQYCGKIAIKYGCAST